MDHHLFFPEWGSESALAVLVRDVAVVELEVVVSAVMVSGALLLRESTFPLPPRLEYAKMLKYIIPIKNRTGPSIVRARVE